MRLRIGAATLLGCFLGWMTIAPALRAEDIPSPLLATNPAVATSAAESLSVSSPAPSSGASAASLASASMSGAQLSALGESSVFRLVTMETKSNAPRSAGTSFAVDTSGKLVTNFHVVSEAALKPEEFQLFLELPQGPVHAKVENIDVVNDLALISISRTLPSALPLASSFSLAPGEVIHSLGFPTGDKLAVVQGTFGGLRNVGYTQAILANLILKQGMSGGPLLDSSGRVVGVNRAFTAKTQSGPVLTPLSQLKELLAQSNRAPAAVGRAWQGRMAEQVKQQEARALADPQRKESYRRDHLAGFSFVIPGANLQCGQSKESGDSLPSASLFQCDSVGLSYLDMNRFSLSVSTVGLGSVPEMTRRRSLANMDRDFKAASSTRKRDRSPAGSAESRCGLRQVRNSKEVDMLVRYCHVSLPDFPGLFSTFVKVEVQSDGKRSADILQSFKGLTLDATAQLLQEMLDSVQKDGS